MHTTAVWFLLPLGIAAVFVSFRLLARRQRRTADSSPNSSDDGFSGVPCGAGTGAGFADSGGHDSASGDCSTADSGGGGGDGGGCGGD